MKLQIAFDLTDLEKSIDIALKVSPYADIIEVGSLLIYKYGIKAIQKFRETLPDKIILADAKIVDRGKEAASIILNSGADWISVLAGTSKDVIHSVCLEAHNLNKKVMLDLIDASSPGQSALDAKSLGIDAILFHQAYDESQPFLFLEKWEMVRGNTQLPIFISAKIKRDNFDTILIKPDGIVIGKAIIGAEDPVEEARYFHDLCYSKK